MKIILASVELDIFLRSCKIPALQTCGKPRPSEAGSDRAVVLVTNDRKLHGTVSLHKMAKLCIYGSKSDASRRGGLNEQGRPGTKTGITPGPLCGNVLPPALASL